MMENSVVAVFFLLYLNVVNNLEFETCKPLKDCTNDDLPPNANTRYRTYFSKFVVSPPCGDEYCVAKKGMHLEIEAQGTALHEGKAAIVKVYEKNVADLTQDILKSKVYLWVRLL